MSAQINKEAFEGEVFTIDMYFSFRWEEGRGSILHTKIRYFKLLKGLQSLST